jgi:hypothetical protein
MKFEHQSKWLDNIYEDFNNARLLMSNAIIESIRYTIYYLLMLFFTLQLLFYSGRYKGVVQVIVIAVIMFFIFFALAYTMKIERWHYIPLIQTSLLFYLIIIATNLELATVFNSKKKQLVFLITLFITISLIFFEVKSRTAEINEKIAIRKEIFKSGENRYIFFDVNTREILDDFVFTRMDPIKNVYLYDMAQLTFTKEYKPYLDDFCDCDAHDMPQFFNSIKDKLSSIDYYSSPYRVNTLSAYLNLVHGMKVSFIPKDRYYLKNNKIGVKELIKYSIEIE